MPKGIKISSSRDTSRGSIAKLNQLQPLVLVQGVADMPLTVKEQEVVAAEILHPLDVKQMQLFGIYAVGNAADILIGLRILLVVVTTPRFTRAVVPSR